MLTASCMRLLEIAFVLVIVFIIFTFVKKIRGVGKKIEEIDNNRGNEMSAAAEQLGMTYQAVFPQGLNINLSEFMLASQGPTVELKHLVRGEVRGINWSIFDYIYNEGGLWGKFTCTVLIPENIEVNTPDLILLPESKKTGGVLPFDYFNRMKFDEDPDFYEKIVVYGEDREGIKSMITGELREILKKHSNCIEVLEVKNKKLIFYTDVYRIHRKSPHTGDYTKYTSTQGNHKIYLAASRLSSYLKCAGEVIDRLQD